MCAPDRFFQGAYSTGWGTKTQSIPGHRLVVEKTEIFHQPVVTD
jgi:hypothetical protein